VIHLQTELAPDLPAIRGIESELREALINRVCLSKGGRPGDDITIR